MSIVSSQVFESDVKPDGMRTYTAQLVADDGQIYGFIWQGTNPPDAVMELLVQRMDRELEIKREAEQIVAGVRLPLTKFEFRSLFTLTERMAIDAFNQGYLNLELTDNQKAMIRTGLEDYQAALSIAVPFLDSVIAMLDLYETLGILSTARKAEILAAGV